MTAEGLLTCSVSVPFTSAAALFFLNQGFVGRRISVALSVIEDVTVDLCASVCVSAVSQSSLNCSEV